MSNFNFYYLWAPMAMIWMWFAGRKKYRRKMGRVYQYVADYAYIFVSAVLGMALGADLLIESHDGILQMCLNSSFSAETAALLVVALVATYYAFCCWFISMTAGERQKRLLKERCCPKATIIPFPSDCRAGGSR